MKIIIIFLIIYSLHAKNCYSNNKRGLYESYNPFKNPIMIPKIYNPILILPSKFEKYNISCQLFNQKELVMQYTPNYTYCNPSYGNEWYGSCNISTKYIDLNLTCFSQTYFENIFLTLVNNSGILNIYTYSICQ